MSETSAIHSTFTLERVYRAPGETVFAAWADPDARAQWFAGGAEHELDFRAGGHELTRALHEGALMAYRTVYHDIVAGRRIVYASTLWTGDTLSTVSVTTVEFHPDGDGTRLVLTEQATYLDGHERPEWRETGTGSQLDALTSYLADVQSEPSRSTSE
jgi:uncharacterized protein YndB with AHSA1/START domain